MALLSTVSRSNWNLEMLVFVEGGKPEYLEKNPRSRDENQQQTQPTYDLKSGNRTRATLVGSECSHHYSVSDTIQAYSEKNLSAPITGVEPKTFRLVKIACRSFYTSELLILELLRMMCYSVSDTIQAYSEKNLSAPITGVEPKTFRLVVRMLYH